MVNTWVPSPREEEYISAWLEYLDESREERVGGAKIVQFLVQSGLEKGTLREIWELGDKDKKGWVNRDQFTLIIRLVSLACSPRFTGKTPSMEIYQETITDRIPLPYSLIDACEATKDLTMSTDSGRADTTKRTPSDTASPSSRMRSNSGEKRIPVSPGGRQRSLSGEKSAPTRRRSSGSKNNDALEIEWLPSLSEERQIDKWFHALDTDPKNGQVGGAKIVQFLVQSGLEKGTLRGIWELGDKDKKGWVNKKQFMLIMRLVAIAIAGQSPTMEKYKATITNSYSFPLPDLPIPGESALLGVAENASSSTSKGDGLTTGDTSLGASVTQSITSGEDGVLSLAGIGSGISYPGGEWMPTMEEGAIIDQWFRSLDEANAQQVGGASIVRFLTKSGLPKTHLHAIWSFGDKGSKGWVSREEFTLVIRLVAICVFQGGEPSMDRYYASSNDRNLPLPPLGDQQVLTVPEVTMTSGPSENIGTRLQSTIWTPYPSDAAKIDEWFTSMACGQPTIGGAKIVPFLLKSGLPKHLLRECWAIGDSDCRGSVDKAQFTLIVRLVMLCLADLSRGGSGNPSLEVYHATAHDNTLPLPPLGLDLAEEEKQLENIILSKMNTLQQANDLNMSMNNSTVASTQLMDEQNGFGDDFGDFTEASSSGLGDVPLVGGADTTDPLHKDIPDMNQNVGINMNVNPVSVQPIGMSAFDELDPPANTSISDAVGERAHSSMPGLGLGSQMGLFVGTRPSEGPSETMKARNNDVVDDFGDDEEFGDFSSNETKSALSMATGTSIEVSLSEPGAMGGEEVFGIPQSENTAFSQISVQLQPSSSTGIDPSSDVNAVDLSTANGVPDQASTIDFSSNLMYPDKYNGSSIYESQQNSRPPPPAEPPQALEDILGAAQGAASNGDQAKPISEPNGLLSIAALEQLSRSLLEMHYYEHAYLAARQMHIKQTLETLTVQKVRAMESDDLEVAVECKRKIAKAHAQLYASEEEACWTSTAAAAVAENCNGTSLADAVELLESMSPMAGSRCRLAYLNRGLTSSDCLSEARFHLQARRTIRLLIALHTTHAGYDVVWPKLLTSIQNMLLKAKQKDMVRFRALSPADRLRALEDTKLTTYATGIVKIAEVGLYLASTMLECGPFGSLKESDLDMARSMDSLGHTLLLEANELWGTTSRLSCNHENDLDLFTDDCANPIQLLQEEALACSARGLETPGNDTFGNDGILEVKYCSLTLRPLGLAPRSTGRADEQPSSLVSLKKAFGAHGQESGVGANTHYNRRVGDQMDTLATCVGGNWFLRAAVDYYTHEVSPTLPPTTGAYVQ